MTDSKNVLLISVFIGFLSLFAFLGAGNYLDISGTDKLNDLEEPNVTSLDLNSYVESNNIKFEKFNNSDPDYGVYDKGLRLNNTSIEGNVTYNIGEYDKLIVTTSKCDYTLGIFLRSEIKYTVYSPNGTVIPNFDERLICGQDQEIDLDERISSSFENVPSEFIEFQIEENNWYLYEIDSQEGTESGFLGTLRTLVNAFILDTNSKWILSLVVIPLTAFAIFILIKYASDYVPFT